MKRPAKLAALGLLPLMTAGNAAAQALEVSDPWPASNSMRQEGGQVLVDAVAEATGGRAALHAGQLGKDRLAVLSSGMADVALAPAPSSPDRMPPSGGLDRPRITRDTCDRLGRLRSPAQEGGLLGMHALFATAPPGVKGRWNARIASIEPDGAASGSQRLEPHIAAGETN